MEESLTCNPFGSKTYCTRTFTNIFADGVSRYRLCADAGITEEIEGMSLEDVDPLDFYYSPQMDKVRQMMIRGEHITILWYVTNKNLKQVGHTDKIITKKSNIMDLIISQLHP